MSCAGVQCTCVVEHMDWGAGDDFNKIPGDACFKMGVFIRHDGYFIIFLKLFHDCCSSYYKPIYNFFQFSSAEKRALKKRFPQNTLGIYYMCSEVTYKRVCWLYMMHGLLKKRH